MFVNKHTFKLALTKRKNMHTHTHKHLFLYMAGAHINKTKRYTSRMETASEDDIPPKVLHKDEDINMERM